MGNLVFLRRSYAYRHAAMMVLRRARAMRPGSERTRARVLARGLLDLAKNEAWLEGQRSHPRRMAAGGAGRSGTVGKIGA